MNNHTTPNRWGDIWYYVPHLPNRVGGGGGGHVPRDFRPWSIHLSVSGWKYFFFFFFSLSHHQSWPLSSGSCWVSSWGRSSRTPGSSYTPPSAWSGQINKAEQATVKHIWSLQGSKLNQYSHGYGWIQVHNVTSVFTTLWTSHRSTSKVHWVNFNIYIKQYSGTSL